MKLSDHFEGGSHRLWAKILSQFSSQQVWKYFTVLPWVLFSFPSLGLAKAALEVPLAKSALEVPLATSALEVPLAKAALEVPLAKAALEVPLAKAALEVPLAKAALKVLLVKALVNSLGLGYGSSLRHF